MKYRLLIKSAIFFLFLIIPLNILIPQDNTEQEIIPQDDNTEQVAIPQDENSEQESIPQDENIEPKACIFLNVNLSEGEYSDYQDIISDIISIELASLGFVIVDEQLWKDIADTRELSDYDLLVGSNAISVAAAVNADIAITGFYYIEEKSIIIDFKCYSVRQNRLIASYIDSGRIGLSLHNLINIAISEMVPQILEVKEYIIQINKDTEDAVDKPAYYELTLLSEDEGMEVYLPENTFLGSIVNGRLIIDTIPFIVGSELIINKRKQGYHSEEELIFLEEVNQEFTLSPLTKETRFAAEIIWTTGQVFGLGMGFRYYIKPDSFFISADDYLYMQYGFNERSSPVFHNDLRMLAGKYLFFSYNSMFRMGVSAGLGCIFSFYSLPEQRLYTDFYINFSNFWVEWNIKQWAIFLRLEGKYTLGIGRNLLGKTFVALDRGFGPPITVGVIRKW